MDKLKVKFVLPEEEIELNNVAFKLRFLLLYTKQKM